MILMIAFLMTSAVVVGADVSAITDAVDRLHEDGRYQESRQLVEANLATAASGGERAELYWRLSRAIMNQGFHRNADPAQQLALYEEGQRAAQQAIDADPANHLGYYWKSANFGRWGQAKGVLNSLFKTGEMRELLRQAVTVAPSYPDAYYVLGQLYGAVPGFPLSFGDVDRAVSLSRRAVDLMEAEVRSGERLEPRADFLTELARNLHKRNWDTARRTREQSRKSARFNAVTEELERGMAYEGRVVLRRESDREEAQRLVQAVVTSLTAMGRGATEQEDLEDAQSLLAEWGS